MRQPPLKLPHNFVRSAFSKPSPPRTRSTRAATVWPSSRAKTLVKIERFGHQRRCVVAGAGQLMLDLGKAAGDRERLGKCHPHLLFQRVLGIKSRTPASGNPASRCDGLPSQSSASPLQLAYGVASSCPRRWAPTTATRSPSAIFNETPSKRWKPPSDLVMFSVNSIWD